MSHPSSRAPGQALLGMAPVFGTRLPELGEGLSGLLENGDVVRKNLNLLKAFRKQTAAFQRRPRAGIAAIAICDRDAKVFDLAGPPDTLQTLHASGLDVGADVSEHEMGRNPLGTALAEGETVYIPADPSAPWAGLAGAGSPLRGDRGPLAGALAVIADAAFPGSALSSLAESLASSVYQVWQLEESRQDILRVFRSLVSHLDCHVLVLDTRNRMLEERHPIPVTEEIRDAMIHIAQLPDQYELEVSLGDRTYVANVRSLTDHRGYLRCKLAIFKDITNHKKLESRILDAEKWSVLTSLAAGIAHEIRNPLTTARGFLQLFLERLCDETDRRFLRLTIDELDRIQRLVTDFMSLAKPGQSVFGLVDLAAALKEVAEFISPQAALSNVTLETELEVNDAWVWGDANQLKQVVLNVLQNAFQACKPKDTVSLRLRVQAGQVTVEVADTGCGMTAEQMARLFQPYYTTKTTGTGLGLTVTKQIMERHGGNVHISSRPGEGTLVTLELRQAVQSLPNAPM
ncbi:ATP-binding protein [Alicyclobacillus macrosporangiidus]|uniref:ATP-binding protein n=1 Tax=Alicyclobacillus macrosporangiidus TaxID=392015 RepID=UPI0012DD96F6|nr:ATP-binding protein [Alicyclobacillus macrosporangiidus]